MLNHLDTTYSAKTRYLAKEDQCILLMMSQHYLIQSLVKSSYVVQGDFDATNEHLPYILVSKYTTVAKFLESMGFKRETLEVMTGAVHKSNLALKLGKIDIAHELMSQISIFHRCNDQVGGLQ